MSTINEYESRRLEKIKRNQQLFAELDIKPIIPTAAPRNQDSKPPASKKRKIFHDTVPTRSSARLASTSIKPSYNEDEDIKTVSLPRSVPRKSKSSNPNGNQQSTIDRSLHASHDEDIEPLVPTKNVEAIRAGWTSWTPTASPPTRDENKVFHFPDHPDFNPNKSPEEMLRQGSFGGSYYRPLRSRKLGITITDDWKELPPSWISSLPVARFLTSPTYDPDVNKFKVSCGQSIEEWEAAGWINHEYDVRGWFQWYTRFFLGRRCEDDERQISRWKKCVGPTGRWRRTLLKRYMQAGVREVFDDGEEEDAVEVSPVVHQTCHHWGFEVRQEHLDEFWGG